jgi:exopolysaccharide biosynthesis protein
MFATENTEFMRQLLLTIITFDASRFIISFLLILCVLCGQSFAQHFTTVHDGVEYAELTRHIGNDPVKINLLRLDLKKVRLDVHHAMDAAIGTEKTSSIAMRHGAVAAINAGFFRLDNSIFAGDAAGILMIDGKLLSESNSDRTALRISNERNETAVEIAPVKTRQFFRIGTRDFEISGTNREVKDNELVLFTPEFHRTTLTGKDIFEIAFEKNQAVFLSNEKGSNFIMANGFVLSASGIRKEELKGLLKLGDKTLLVTNFMAVQWRGSTDISSSSGVEDIVAGVPQLIKNGKIDITWEQEKSSKAFVETRHPRTAVAKLKDGKFLMLTVDGRQPGVSVGMNLNELAAYLLELGAVDAMNFDGGGSTTMFLEGMVVNKPSDKDGERKVSDAILVTLRKKR